MTSVYDKPQITAEELQAEVLLRTEKYNGKSFLECFSMYLGTAQLLEFALKKLLQDRFSVPAELLELKTLGQVRAKLEEIGVGNDYTDILKEVVKDRNYAAHELLANNMLIGDLGVTFSEHFEFKELSPIIFKLERAVFLYDYIQHNDGWVISSQHSACP